MSNIEKKLDLLYEYIDTNDQSASDVSGVDNYFRNNVYRSGWSYEGAIIGMPLILIDNSFEVTDSNSPIISNRVQAHHFGLAAKQVPRLGPAHRASPAK